MVICDSTKSLNEENYLQDVVTNNLSLTGIYEECVWNQINGFHAVLNYSVELMHDILGICSYDMSGILDEFIFNFKYFSLEQLNNRIQYFNYGSLDVKNKPQIITNDV